MSATIVTTLASSAIPQQPGPSFRYRASATNVSVPAGLNFPAFGQTTLNPIYLNYMLVDLANLAAMGGCGCGIARGLTLSSSSGLTVTLAAGNGVGPGGLVESSAGSTVTVTDNAVTYVWLTTAGALATSATTSVPTNGAIYLGAATAVSGTVTTIDNAGVVNLSGGRPIRITADVGYPLDSPAFPMLAKTLAGAFEWDGAAWRALGVPVYTRTVSATVTLASTSAPRQVINGGAATRKVLVPSSRIADQPLEVHNSGTTNDLQIRDSGDTTTLATLTPGQSAVLYPHFGSTAYPTAISI